MGIFRSWTLRAIAISVAVVACVYGRVAPSAASTVPDRFAQQAELTASDGQFGHYLGESVAISGSTIAVADGTAVYVYDRGSGPWGTMTQTAKLTTTDGGQLSSVGISGDTIAAGADERQTGNGLDGRGAVYVFVRPTSGWRDMRQTAKLTASDPGVQDQLGFAVAISGDTVVAGAPDHQVGSNFSQGAAYVFVKGASGWRNMTQTAELTAAPSGVVAGEGRSVAISPTGRTIAVGAPDSNYSNDSGLVLVYEKPVGAWKNMLETAALTGSDGGQHDRLGASVAASDDAVVAGAPGHQVQSAMNEGVAYVFTRDQLGAWVSGRQTAELAAADGAVVGGGYGFGSAVAMAGPRIVVGAPYFGPAGQVGAAYVFDEPAAGWPGATQSQELTVTAPSYDDDLGTAVAVDGATIVAGAPNHHGASGAASGPGPGAAFVFAAPPTVAITTPRSAAVYGLGENVPAAYSCAAAQGASLVSCNGTVANGAPLATSTAGSHSFSVTALDSDGETARSVVSYTVLAPAAVQPAPLMLGAFRESAPRWREPGHVSHHSRWRRLPVGTTFSFSLSERATVAFAFDRIVVGRLIAGRCVVGASARLHRGRCTMIADTHVLTLAARAGANVVEFNGRLGSGRRLAAGRYLVVITAATTAGQQASAGPLRFAIEKLRIRPKRFTARRPHAR